MDLSSTPFDRETELRELPGDLAALIAGVALRQAAGATVMTRLLAAADPLLAQPLTGAFDAAMAGALVEWRKG